MSNIAREIKREAEPDRPKHVLANPQSYLSIAYLLITFPFGIVYFVFLVTGVVLSIGLMPIFIGFPLLLAVVYASKQLYAFEQYWAYLMIGGPRPSLKLPPSTAKGIFGRLKEQLTDPLTYQSMLYLLLQFPLGIVSFVVAVTILSVSVGLVATPIVFYSILNSIDIDIMENTPMNYMGLSSEQSAWVSTGIGIVLLFAVIPICRLAAQTHIHLISAFRQDGREQ